MGESAHRDASLVDAIARGDAGAFREVYERLDRKVFRLAYATLLDRAEAADVVQEAFVQLHVHAAQWRKDAELDGWLCRVALNAALSVRRRLLRFHRPWSGISAVVPNPERALAAREGVSAVQVAMARLPKAQRAVLALHLDLGLEPSQFASILGVTPNAARVRLHRGMAALRENLRAAGIDVDRPADPAWTREDLQEEQLP